MQIKFTKVFSPSLLLAFVFISSLIVACQRNAPQTTNQPAAVEGENISARSPDLSSFFKNTDGAFVLYDLKQNRYMRYNDARCRERFSPKSTFKIPNSLIGLETGVIRDADFVINWDRRKYPSEEWGRGYPFEHWAQDHTLRSAIKYSVLWYYRELASRVGERRMREYVRKLGYGNQNTGKRVDGFWLDHSLRISADEQVEFLKKLYAEQLPVSRRSIEIVKDILVLEQTPTYRLSGKTGGGSKGGTGEGKIIGWFIGYVEREGNVIFFALNIDGENYPAIRDKRAALTKQILASQGYLPQP